MTDQETRAEFARRVTLIVMVCANAINQALDPTKPALTYKDVVHFVTTVQDNLDLLSDETIIGE